MLAPVLKAEVKQRLGLEECRQTSNGASEAEL